MYGRAKLADPSNPDEFIASCDHYMGARTGKYEWRRIRYRAALGAMQQIGLTDEDTIVDVGAGWTEFDYCLRTEGSSRCRYIPVDGAFDGTNLEEWVPPRTVEYFVALELVEHLYNPLRLIAAMQEKATKGVILSTPNPRTTDVLGMDADHKTAVGAAMLREIGFTVQEESFYGQENDSLFAVLTTTGHPSNMALA